MRTRGLLMLLGLVCLTTVEPRAAQVGGTNPERLLAERFGFTSADVAQARSGKAVAKLLPSKDSAEIGVVAAVYIASKPERLTVWLKDIANFRKAAELGLSRKLNNPPQIGDFADLSFDPEELAELRGCRPGKCDLRMGNRALQRFQTEVDWTAADAPRRANLLARQLMLNLAEAYLKGGDEALGAYSNEKKPRLAADDFRRVLSQSKTLYDVTPALANYLWHFPKATLPNSEQLLFWAKGGLGPEASITLHQLITWHQPGGAVVVTDKQLYASRYTDAGLLVIVMVPTPDGAGFYAIVGARARADALQGVMARVLRGQLEKSTRDAAEMYLTWIRDSLSIASGAV